ncbi:flavodoxin family protein [Candidatus Bathyarchaeota archaeon]|nr:flavodoxin family protein [Candidatus Bathyarchaeota archaeon]
MKVLVVYDSRTGNTEKMAVRVANAVEDNGLEVSLKKVDNASVDELPNVEALILGSPVYYGLPTAKIKGFIDESIKYHGKLTHLVGGAFCSAGGTHTGSESTILALLESMLVHGMILQGNPHGNHYGPAATGPPDEKTLDHCEKLAKRICDLVKKLNS